jgi:hypothetical protein
MGLEVALISQLAGTASKAYSEYGAIGSQLEFAKRKSETNQAILAFRADQELRIGAQQESAIRARGRAIEGAQKTALASNGVDVSTGTPAQLTADTRMQTEIDALRIRSNAMRAAWGLDFSAVELRNQQRMNRLAAKNAQGNTLLTGLIGAGQAGASYGFFKSRYPIDETAGKGYSYKTPEEKTGANIGSFGFIPGIQ